MLYYKSFNEKLQGKNNYQYEVGKEFSISHSDTWEWLHFAQYVSSTLIHSSDSEKIRICIVKPLGKTKRFKAYCDGYNKGYYFSTNRIKIERELTDIEILNKLIEENCPFLMILKYINPPYSYLLDNKKKIRGNSICSIIRNRKDLSIEEKCELLPKSQCKWLLKSYRSC